MGTHRASQGLSQNEHVRGHVLGLVGEHGAGAAEARLHLVDQEGACASTELLRVTEVVARGRDHPAFALDGLDEEGGNLLRFELFLQGGEVAEGDSVAVAEQGLEGGAQALVAHHREGAQVRCMESLPCSRRSRGAWWRRERA